MADIYFLGMKLKNNTDTMVKSNFYEQQNHHRKTDNERGKQLSFFPLHPFKHQDIFLQQCFFKTIYNYQAAKLSGTSF